MEDAGIISLAGQTVRFTRPGLVEEYSVSMDGVRQDFLVPERPVGAGELAVRLAVSGARVEPAAAGARPVRYPQQIEEAEHGSSLSHGARLVLDNSGRKLAYSRLRVTDATGRELTARMEVASGILPPGIRVRIVPGLLCETRLNPPGWKPRLYGRQGCLPLQVWSWR